MQQSSNGIVFSIPNVVHPLCIRMYSTRVWNFSKKNRKKQEFNFPLGKVFTYFQFRSYFVLCRESILEDRLSFAHFTQNVLTRRRKDPVDRPKRFLLNRLSQLCNFLRSSLYFAINARHDIDNRRRLIYETEKFRTSGVSWTNRLNFSLVIINITGERVESFSLLFFLFFFLHIYTYIYIYVSFKAFFERQKIEREVGRTFFFLD